MFNGVWSPQTDGLDVFFSKTKNPIIPNNSSALKHGPPHSTTTPSEYVGDSWQKHEAGGDCGINSLTEKRQAR